MVSLEDAFKGTLEVCNKLERRIRRQERITNELMRILIECDVSCPAGANFATEQIKKLIIEVIKEAGKN